MDNTDVMKDAPNRQVLNDKPVGEALQAGCEGDLLGTWQDTLLRPGRVWSPRELMGNSRHLPCSPGVYGWWFRSVPPGVPAEGTLKGRFGALLYVGIAGRGLPIFDGSRSMTFFSTMPSDAAGPVSDSVIPILT